jgi:hypothetical protein
MSRAVSSSNWNAALFDQEYLAIDEAPGRIILSDEFRKPVGQNIVACAVVRGIFAACVEQYSGQHELIYQRMRDLIMSALPQFWFCLGILGLGSTHFPDTATERTERQSRSKAILKALLRWWPVFCQLEHRFEPSYGTRWSAWSYVPLKLSFNAGMSKSEVEELMPLSSAVAGERIRGWYERAAGA